MAWFPCNIGGGGGGGTDVRVLLYSIDESQGGVWINSHVDPTELAKLRFIYSVNEEEIWTKVVNVSDIAVYTGGADVYTTIFDAGISGRAFNVRIYNDELWVSYNGVGLSTQVVGVYKDIVTEASIVAEGTFTSSSTEHGIVDVNVGFKPDLVMVFMPFAGGNDEDTCSYWEKNASWADTNAIWCITPAEGGAYEVALGRTQGETGIQQINSNGFSYMSNAAYTRGCPCRYVAIKYEEGGDDPFEYYTCCNFGSNGGIILPYTLNSDYKVTVEFYETQYYNDACVIGNTFGANRSHLTEFSNKWFTSSGTGETSFGSWVGNVAHTFINNNGNNKNEFDGVEVTDYTPATDANIWYTIGCRTGTVTSNQYRGYIKSYKIESISTGDVICYLRPAKFVYPGVISKEGLFDSVNEVWYDNGTMVVSNDY